MESVLLTDADGASQAIVDSLSPVVLRFIRYVQINTQSDPASTTVPSTERQKDLGRLLVQELEDAGVSDVAMDDNGYVYARLPEVSSSSDQEIGLLAHLDTSPDEPGSARPMVHFNYDGSIIRLADDVTLDPSQRPELLHYLGDHIITSDGTTLLGSDDKSGVAILMQLAEDLLHDGAARPALHLCFTIDEEIGRGVDHLDLERFHPNVAYTIDGGGLDTIYAETFNAAEAIVDVQGTMVHPGYAKNIMVNALRIVSKLIARLPDAEAPETTEGREGYIHPHHLYSSDPTHARAKIILRDFTDAGLAHKKALLSGLVEALRTEHPRAEIGLRIRDEYRNMRTYIEESDPRAVSFAHAAARHVDIELVEKLVRGGTDGARLSEKGIPTPNIFNGGHDYHSRFEWNTAGSIDRALQYVKALVRYWGSHG